LQDCLRKQANIRHNDLFQALEPILFKYYQNILAKYPNDPRAATEKLYRNVATVEELVHLKTQINSRQNLQTAIAHRRATPYSWENTKTQNITKAIEAFISSLDFGKIDRENELLLFSHISNLRHLRRIQITNSSAFSKRLIESLHPLLRELKKLTLVGCDGITLNDIKMLIAAHPKLILILGENKQVGRKEWIILKKTTPFLYLKVGEARMNVSLDSTLLLHRVLVEEGEHIQMILFALEMGADPNKRASYVQFIKEETAMHIAASSGKLRSLKMLVENGGDISREDGKGRSVLENVKEHNREGNLNEVITYLKEIEWQKNNK